jgi:hypothetical protein
MYRTIPLLILAVFLAAVPAVTRAQAEDVPLTGSGSVYCPHLSQTMVRGARDRTTVPPGQVTELQTFLSDYYDIDPDDIITGYFGALTHRNVVRFQREQGLPAFGIVGPLTRAAIARVCGIPQPTTIKTCTFNGKTIADGESVLAYASSTAPWQRQCVSETRTCVKGVLTGSYKNASCVEQPCNNTTDGCGPVLPLTPTISFSSKNAKVAPGQQTTLTWSATNAAWCSASGGWTGMKAASGTQESGIIWGTTTFTLTCFSTDGLKSATKSVTVSVIPEEPVQKRSCTQDGVTVAHGASRIFYSYQSPATGNACRDNLIPSELRTCNDGVLSGSYPYASCTVGTTQGQPTFSATPTSETGHSLSVTFTIGNLDSTTANQQFTVSFGDGTSGTINGPGCSGTNSIPGSINCGTTASISHTYTAGGTYTATLSGPCSVKFSGCSGPVLGSVTITVSTPPQTGPLTDANCEPLLEGQVWYVRPLTGSAPLPATVSFGNPTNYPWNGFDFGDGTKLELKTWPPPLVRVTPMSGSCTRHTYAAPGIYTIKQTLNGIPVSPGGLYNKTSETVTVY